MLIVLEGADMVGKTTLADALIGAAVTRGVERIALLSAGPPDPGRTVMEIYEHDLLAHRSQIMDPGTLIVADRWHLGELIYGPLLRDQSLLTPASMEHVELLLDALGAVRVVVTVRKPGDIVARFQERGDDLVSLKQIQEINKWYVYWQRAEHARRWSLVHSPADFEVVDTLIGLAEARTQLVQHLTKHPTYIGPAEPNTLFVGDVPNGWIEGMPPQLAFVPHPAGNSADYLLSAMLQGRINNVGLVNSADSDLRTLWEDLGAPHVLSLGKRAAARLVKAGIPYALTMHPQWVRRFKHHELDQYTGILTRHAEYPRQAQGVTA